LGKFAAEATDRLSALHWVGTWEIKMVDWKDKWTENLTVDQSEYMMERSMAARWEKN
jgi:hypothetical protein